MATPRQVNDIARALVGAAHDKQEVGKVVADLAAVNEAFQANPELLASLRERAMPIEKRAGALKTALKKDVHQFVTNALLTLQHADLLHELPAFRATVTKYAQETAGHYEVRVISALPMENAELKELGKVVEKKFGGTHRLNAAVDPSILGGLVIEIGDWHVDASVKGKIESLKRVLI